MYQPRVCFKFHQELLKDFSPRAHISIVYVKNGSFVTTGNKGFMANLIHLICLSNYLSTLLNGPHMYRIGIKCTDTVL